MEPMQQIERLAEQYAATREALAGVVMALEDELRAVKRRHVARIRKLAQTAKANQELLAIELGAHKALFEKPRTRTFHGVKVGWQKGKGRIEWEEDAQVVKLIRRHFPEQAEILITVKETPVKATLQQLTAQDLKRLGVTVVDASDEPVIKDAVGEVDRLVEALLKIEDVEEVV